MHTDLVPGTVFDTRLLALHPAHAADAFQLATALLACSEHPKEANFRSSDRRLWEAEEREDFRVHTGGRQFSESLFIWMQFASAALPAPALGDVDPA